MSAGLKAYQEFKDVVEHNKNSDMLYSEYLDYWMTEYFEINYRYNTSGCQIKDVSKILGHSRIETTQNYYITSFEEFKKEVIESIEEFLKEN